MSQIDAYQDYLKAGTTFARLSPSTTSQETVYALFNRDSRDLLPFVDTGLAYPGENGQMGSPSRLRAFEAIRFGGGGTLFVNVWIDAILLIRDAKVVLAEDPYQASILTLPNGTAGFGIRLQMTGLAWVRWMEFEWDYLEAQ